MENAIQNAQAVSKVLKRLDGNLKNKDMIWKFFHLRPTSSGVTLVSHHSFAPMRGADCSVNQLEEKLRKLNEQINTFAAEHPDEKKLSDMFTSCGFMHRGTQTENEREEDIQAAFISGMITKDAEYEGIHFLASELILKDEDAKQENRFDVIGYKDNTVYIFELKRGRETDIYQQIARYREHFEHHRQEFIELLAAYPRTACPEAVEIKSVKYMAVMKDALLSKTDWASLTDVAGVDTWFFRPALAFRKLTV